ncbi:MAG: UDP-4-amino-4,6-dideoxy-N-acetyl-beta-L-altrosamine transaminase [Bacteroidales bacterium]|nr:UDP-4-amino-4,6-dideoxy-N-acetyl-beta-L-altrosamine transaminase [Bacteroidales bacterium]
MIMDPIPYGRQHITQQDIDAVVEVLKSDYLTQGPKIAEFEEAFAGYIGTKYAVAVANGTAALHLCNLAIGTKPGDKVITSPITFVASTNSVLYCGGEIDFVDIDPKTYLMDLDKLEMKLANSHKGTFKGIIPVDFAGYPVNLERLRSIANKYNLWIIEDACHAPGGYFIDSEGEKQYCGNGKFADLAIFSFHPVKHIATGEGGMITTNNKDLYKKLLLLRTHGITKDANLFQNTIETAIGNELQTPNSELQTYPGWYYEMQDLGFNYRLTDFQAALGISQLSRAEEGVKERNRIAKKYDEAFTNNEEIKIPFVDDNIFHAFHLYVIQVKKRKGLYDYLRENNIFTQVHYIPVHLQPFYKYLGWKKGELPIAEKYYEHCLSLPIYPTLTDVEQSLIINTIINFYIK